MSLRSRFESFIDSAVYAFSPSRGAERIITRKRFNAAQANFRSFESAESNRHREGKWLGSMLSADASLEEDLETTRQRSRELYRNEFIGGAIDSRVEHSIGTGFTVQARIKERTGVITTEQAKERNAQLEEAYEQWEPIACRTRKKSLWQKTCLAARCVDADGETFVVMSDIGGSESPIPLCIEVIDCDRVETPPAKIADPLCRLGIQYDKNKQITGYWIRKSHPNDDKEFSTEYDFVPSWRVQHVFIEWFAGQSRGLPWMTRALNRSKDGKDLQEAGIIKAQVETCFAGFIKSKTNPLNKAIGAATSTSGTDRLQDVRPGSLTYLGSDDEIIFSTPTSTNAVGTLQEYNNRTIAAGLNWPYEMLMKDWRGVSFAGGRIILNSAKISTKVRQKLIAESLLRPIWNRFVDECVIVGAVDIDSRTYRDNQFVFRRHTWKGPEWSYAITPGEEVKAKVTAIDNNLMTLADALAESQQDLEEVVAQRTIEREMLRQGKIMPNAVAETEAVQQSMQDQAQQQEQGADNATN